MKTSDLNLLYILSEYLPDSGGGIITHYSRMLPQLVRRGHSVKVILASVGKLDLAAYEIDGVTVEPLRSEFLARYQRCFERFAGLDIFYFMLPVAWAAWAQAQENFDYDLVETTDWALLFAPWVAGPKKAPVVLSLHGSCGQVDWYSHTGGERSLGGDLVRMAELASLHGADVIHSNSRTNAEFWRARTGCEITVIPPVSAGEGSLNRNLTTEDTEGTEDQFIQKQGGAWASQAGAAFSNPVTIELARDCENTSLNRSAMGPASSPATSYSLPATAPKARGLVVGRLQKLKGAEVLCQTLRLVPEIRVEWLGSDTTWDECGTKASEYLASNYPDVWGSRLMWLGRVDRSEVVNKIHDAAFLVVPSILDVFNLTVAEAMEARVPVVCSRAAGAEMLIEHGRSGFLFESGNTNDLAECIRQVTDMDAAKREEMTGRAQANVKRIMDSNHIVEMLETSYAVAVKKGFSASGDEWRKNLFAPGPPQPLPAPTGVLQRAIRKAGRILSSL